MKNVKVEETFPVHTEGIMLTVQPQLIIIIISIIRPKKHFHKSRKKNIHESSIEEENVF